MMLPALVLPACCIALYLMEEELMMLDEERKGARRFGVVYVTMPT
jgi:hypothetical protein